MAANFQNRGLASFGKLFVGQICPRDSVVAPLLSLRKGVHASAYDKNVEEEHHSSVVPDNVIPPQPEKYWAPHPQTGVFGPASDQKLASGGDNNFIFSDSESVLEQKAFFRSIEDLDKPAVHP